MTDHQHILNDVLEIDPENDFLKYIVKRVRHSNYRGHHISQHNRYNLPIAQGVLKIIYETVGDKKFVSPPGDLSQYKAGLRTLDSSHREYEEIIDRVRKEIPSLTNRQRENQFDTVKKNLFPDFQKLGFIDRTKNRRVVRVTSAGKNFIRSRGLDSYRIFTSALDNNLFGDFLTQLVEMLSLSDYREDEISIYELMFIFSDPDLNNEEKIEMLDAYRSLSEAQQKKMLKLIKEYARPERFSGTKTDKRDFHNWRNEWKQNILLLQQTVYFEAASNESFRLNTGRVGFFERRTERRSAPKKKYFGKHGVEKRKGFELHHIVPLSEARNKVEARLIDNYKNLIYISHKKHKKFLGKGKGHVVLDITPTEARFSHLERETRISVQNEKEAVYSKKEENIRTMYRHNKSLVRKIFS